MRSVGGSEGWGSFVLVGKDDALSFKWSKEK